MVSVYKNIYLIRMINIVSDKKNSRFTNTMQMGKGSGLIITVIIFCNGSRVDGAPDGRIYGDKCDALWRLRLRRHLMRALACSEAVVAVDSGFLVIEK